MPISSSKFSIELKKMTRIKAYRNFLKKRHIKVNLLKSIKNLESLPITDKRTYVTPSKLKDLFVDGKIPPMIYASSGSSGRPTFWFRGDEQERVGGEIHAAILDKIFDIKKNETTLVVICFSMGVWIAGNYTLASFREVARTGYNLSIVSPGTEKEDIFNVLKNLAPEFDNLILTGYPPFVMDIVDESLKLGIKFKNKKIKIITAGDKFSERWRSDILNLLDLSDSRHNSIVAIYGSADAGVMGHETPISVFLRKESLKNKKLATELFGKTNSDLPAIVQYYPSEIRFESIKNEFILTTKTAMPLIRYDIHDTGRIITYDELKRILKRRGLLNKALGFGLEQWKLPLLILTGRTDVAVTFYALNIYPEHLNAAISDSRISKFLSGNFIALNKTSNNSRTQKLYIKLELANIRVRESRIRELVTKVVIEQLSKVNIEYRKLLSIIGEKAIPVILFNKPGDTSFSASEDKSIVYKKGKKPKVILATAG